MTLQQIRTSKGLIVNCVTRKQLNLAKLTASATLSLIFASTHSSQSHSDTAQREFHHSDDWDSDRNIYLQSFFKHRSAVLSSKTLFSSLIPGLKVESSNCDYLDERLSILGNLHHHSLGNILPSVSCGSINIIRKYHFTALSCDSNTNIKSSKASLVQSSAQLKVATMEKDEPSLSNEKDSVTSSFLK